MRFKLVTAKAFPLKKTLLILKSYLMKKNGSHLRLCMNYIRVSFVIINKDVLYSPINQQNLCTYFYELTTHSLSL